MCQSFFSVACNLEAFLWLGSRLNQHFSASGNGRAAVYIMAIF